MTAGAALKAFLIFQSSDCCADVKTPGGSGSLTGGGSSARADVASALSPNKSMNLRFMWLQVRAQCVQSTLVIAQPVRMPPDTPVVALKLDDRDPHPVCIF